MRAISRCARRCLLLLAVGWTIASGSVPAAHAQGARKIYIRALDGLRFDQLRFAVEPGVKVRLMFENRDESGMPHNFLITRPGAREAVVQQALALGTRGAALKYVPPTDLVLWAVPIMGPDESLTIEFTAPKERGVYPYVCTFPGHGFVMYGAMYVGTEMPELAADENLPAQARALGAAPAAPEPLVRPALARYLMPDVGPAAIAVALPGDQNYVWDAGTARLRYAWTGDFIDRSASLQGDNAALMQLPAKLLGKVYYRAGTAYPIRIGTLDGEPATRFRGYRLVDGLPEFRYEVGGVEVRELIRPAAGGTGLVRTFTLGPATGPVFFVAEGATGVRHEASAGTWDGPVLRLDPADARSFSVTMTRSDR